MLWYPFNRDEVSASIISASIPTTVNQPLTTISILYTGFSFFFFSWGLNSYWCHFIEVHWIAPQINLALHLCSCVEDVGFSPSSHKDGNIHFPPVICSSHICQKQKAYFYFLIYFSHEYCFCKAQAGKKNHK